MRTVLFIQGGGEGVHDEWDNHLVDSLERELGPDYRIAYPRMPDEAEPRYVTWKAELKRQCERLVDGAIIVAHSIGGTILVRVLADEPPPVALGGVFLIAAPFVGEGGWPSDEMESLSDIGPKLPRELPVFLYHGSKDETAPPRHVDLYARAIPQAVVRRLRGRDHQLNNDLSEVASGIRSLRR